LAFQKAEARKREALKKQKGESPSTKPHRIPASTPPQKTDIPNRPPSARTTTPPPRSFEKQPEKEPQHPPPSGKKRALSHSQKKPCLPVRPTKSHPPPPQRTATPIPKRHKESVDIGLTPLIDDSLTLDLPEPIVPPSRSPAKTPLPLDSGADQIHDGHPSEENDVVIGFDFGTSSSKVVIRDVYLKTAYAVPFDNLACPENPYLVPTRIFITDDGFFSLYEENGHRYTDLKAHLMDDPTRPIYEARSTGQQITAQELTAAYLALVIRHARSWFLQQTRMIYKTRRIYWQINLGIPSKNYDDKEMRDAFRTAALAAWRGSRHDDSIGIVQIKEYVQHAHHLMRQDNDMDDDNLWLSPDLVNTHPEVIMEVIGYIKSPLRKNGLHILVDIGATTVDAASFIVHREDEEDVYPLLATNVEKYGTIELHRHRMTEIKKRLEENMRCINHINPMLSIPRTSHYEINVSTEIIQDIDNTFKRECHKIVGDIIHRTRMFKDPYSRSWNDGVPLFICGGGGRYPLYKDTIDELDSLLKRFTHFNGFRIRTIPKPDDLKAPSLSPLDYDRLAVAYGLSFHVDDIGRIIPESKIKDLEKEDKILDTEKIFVSKELC